MKITEKSICSIIVSKDFRDFHIDFSNKVLNSSYEMNDNQRRTLNEKINFYHQSGFRMLVFSNKSKENLENYLIPKEIRLEVLRGLPNRKDVIQIDDNNCIKYVKTDDTLSFITCYRKTDKFGKVPTMDDMIHTHFFNVDLKTGYMGFDESNTYTNEEIKDVKTFIDKYYSRFLVVVTYLELTDVTLNIVEGSLSKNKNKKSNLTISNSSRFNVIHVNTNWNTMIINVNTFGVRGHWRLQLVGIGRSQYKYVWVKPYEKGITRRLPQKELVG
jgi:hypothetical protein